MGKAFVSAQLKVAVSQIVNKVYLLKKTKGIKENVSKPLSSNLK